MPEGELPERPRGTLTTEQTTQPEQAESGRSHEQLVKAFRDLIKQNAEVYADIRSPHERGVKGPASAQTGRGSTGSTASFPVPTMMC